MHKRASPLSSTPPRQEACPVLPLPWMLQGSQCTLGKGCTSCSQHLAPMTAEKSYCLCRNQQRDLFLHGVDKGRSLLPLNSKGERQRTLSIHIGPQMECSHRGGNQESTLSGSQFSCKPVSAQPALPTRQHTQARGTSFH